MKKTDNIILQSMRIAIGGQIQKINVLTDVITKPERVAELATLKVQLQNQLKQLNEV